ncbi:MAG TPA: glycosyltransferase [bacterium]|nr:glycosyltransferase [bacterium]HPN81632.1 glycosyltransferase [bacterium]HPW39838.1 glycosyltransferase [bacterium]
MTDFIKRHKIFFALFIMALALRLFFFGLMMWHYGSGSFYLDNDGVSLDGNDSQHYVLIARNITEHGVYSRFVDEPFQPTAFRTPLLSLYFVPFIYLFGFSNIWLAILILDIILSLTPILVYFLANLFLSKKKSFLIAMLVALEPLLAYRSNLAEPDALMILLFLLSLYFLLLFWLDRNKSGLLWSAASLGLLSLAKPVGLYLLAVFILFVLCKKIFFPVNFKKLILDIFWAVIIFAAIVSPWLIRNKIVFDHFSMSSVQAFNFYLFYTADLTQSETDIVFDPAIREPERDLRSSDQLMELSLLRIANQPIKYSKNHLTGTIRLLMSDQFQSFYYYGHQKLLPFSVEPRHQVDLTGLVSSGNYFKAFDFLLSWKNFSLIARYLFLIAVYFLVAYHWMKSFWQDKKVFVVFSLFALLSFYFVFAAGPYVDPKYRLPIIPLLLIMLLYNFQNKKFENKIVIASGTYLPEVSGQSTFVSGLIKNLSAETVWSVVAYGEKREIREDKIFIVPRSFWRYFNYWRIVRKQAKDAKIIFAQDLVSSGWPAALAKRAGQKLVIRIGGDFLWEKMVNSRKSEVPLSQYYDQSKNLTEKIYLTIYRLVLGRADMIVFNNKWQKEIYQKIFNLPDSKVSLVENPFTNRAVKRPADSYNADEIIFSGRFIPLKNLIRLIEAFKQIKTNKKLVLIGDGPEREKLEQFNGNSIFIEGKMDYADLLERFATKGFLFVLPSISEMNPNAAIEALSIGVPVLLTKENGLADDLKNRCKLIDPLSTDSIKEGIEYFLDEDNYRDYLFQRAAAENSYSWSDMADRFLSIFESL